MLQILKHVLSCKNICERLKTFTGARYRLGLRWCRICEASFDTIKHCCQCCGTVLRRKRHSWAKPGKRSRLDKLIASREQNRQYFRRWYQKHKGTTEFRRKYNEKKRSHYTRHASKICAKRLQSYYEKKWILTNLIT